MNAEILYGTGETKKIRITLTDDDGAALNLTGYQDVRVGIARKDTPGTLVLSRIDSTDADSLILVTAATGIVDVFPTLAESLLLDDGRHYVDVGVKLGDKWSYLRRKIEMEVRTLLNPPTV